MARDHFGVKPFYYFHNGKHFAFASEIKALLQVPEIQAELDPESLHQYLTFLWVPDPKTMFRRILKLPAGHYATLRKGELKLTQYWDLSFPPANQMYSAVGSGPGRRSSRAFSPIGRSANDQRRTDWGFPQCWP